MTTASPTSPGNEVDIDAFALNLVLSQVFQDMLRKPESTDDSDAAQSSGVANEINKPIATAMAQGITGFGL
jgi:hypothetical protein